MSVVASLRDFRQVGNAQYRREVTAIVRSVRVESDWIKHSETDSLSTDRKQWITKEEIQVDGKSFIYQGMYSEEPGETILHTIISDDGVNWMVNDSKGTDVIFSAIAGIIFGLVGIAVVWFEYKRRN